MDDDYNISYGIYLKGFSSHLPTPREYRFPSNRPFSLSEPRHLRSKYVSRAKQASPRAFPELRLRQPGPTIKTSCPLKTNDHRNICSNALPPEFQNISLKIWDQGFRMIILLVRYISIMLINFSLTHNGYSQVGYPHFGLWMAQISSR